MIAPLCMVTQITYYAGGCGVLQFSSLCVSFCLGYGLCLFFVNFGKISSMEFMMSTTLSMEENKTKACSCTKKEKKIDFVTFIGVHEKRETRHNTVNGENR